jgi:prophage antirepressor-like protein
MRNLTFEDTELQIIEHKEFEFLLTTKEVAKGYGVSIENIRSQKANHQDELIEGKHFISNFMIFDGHQNRKTTVWTKRGIIRLGFFIKSERAKRFRDWAEDLILESVEEPKFSQLSNLEIRAKQIHIATNMSVDFRTSFWNVGIKNPEELAITVNRAVKNETEIDFIELAGKKGIETDTRFLTVTELCEYVRNSNDFSEEQKLSVSTKKNDKPRPQKLNEILREQGFQEKIDGN